LFQCQGATIHKQAEILADLNETFQAAMCYVILSRIVCLEQLHLQTFKPSKIYCNEEAKLEALSIKARALNKQFNRWHQRQRNCFKLSSLNVRSLQKHFQDLKDDNFLQQCDILCVNETWLVDDPDKNFEGFSSHYLTKRSKGVAMFTKIVPENLQRVHTETMSMIFARFQLFDLLSVYKFAEVSRIDEFTEQILEYVDLSRPVILIGDINIDLLKQPQNKFSKQLKDLRFVQLVNEATHISGGLLDHLYVYFPKDGHCELFKIHPLYYSDHDAVCCILEFP
jgi:hypothetical protein